jgi:hypothetical protein
MFPTAQISVNRNRMKTYGTCVYLKSGTNFEIELWNPRQFKVMARIEIDGKPISASGIIVNPGQRVYLERWIDEPRSFKFSTYEAEDSEEGKNATANNGRVKVVFYDEVTKNYFPSGYWPGAVITTTGGSFPPTTTTTDYFYSTNIIGGFANFSSNITASLNTSSSNIKSFETGITEKGDTSSQKLQESSGDFNTWASTTVEWQILPESAKPIEINKVRSYCTECGTRVRASSWKFCPSCGEKF